MRRIRRYEEKTGDTIGTMQGEQAEYKENEMNTGRIREEQGVYEDNNEYSRRREGIRVE